jgi:hypothetical protein
LPITAQIILNCAATLISLGGLYDVLVPKLPSNFVAMCHGNAEACKLARELLRALGGSLFAVGATVALLVNGVGLQNQSRTILLILMLVVPAEGINAFCMYRVRSPFFIPLTFVLLTVLGVVIALANHNS